jgi:HTH-type transcriptional regulator, sugar sensing transcriptional regulator
VAVKAAVEDRVVTAMNELGFTVTDAKAYVALLKNHPATGYELAARSGVPRSAVYNVLKRLEGLGLVTAVQDKPAKYRPLPPKHLLELVESRLSRTVQDLRESLESLSTPTTEAATLTVQGYGSMLEQAQLLITAAKRSLHASLWGREADRLSPVLRRAAEAGIDVVIFSFNPLPPDTGRHFSYGIAEHQLEKYWSHKVIMIADTTRALVGGAEETEDNRVVVTEEMALVEMALSNLVLDITLFGQRHDIDTAEVVSHLTVHLAPVEELVKSSLK